MTASLQRALRAWHDLATRHLWLVYTILIVEALAATAVCLRQGGMDSDIWSLFSPQDPVVAEFRELADRNQMARSIFVRLDATRPADLRAHATSLHQLPLVETVVPLPPRAPAASPAVSWLQIVLADNHTAATRETTVTAVRDLLDQQPLTYGLTGSDVVMQEFKTSIWRDFGISSLISLILVCSVVAIGYHWTHGIWIGLLCELCGLLVGLALFLGTGGQLNLLSATVPCVLVGLGVDFVIHSVSAATRGEQTPDLAAGLHVYQAVVTPMFWGALTTALAFFSLALAQLDGLRQVGLLGGIGILAMFTHVALLLPPVLTRYPPHITSMAMRVHALVPRRHPRLWGILLGLACLAVLPFARQLKMEQRIDRLYDPQLPSLAVQSQLADRAGTYPSTIFAAFETRQPAAVIAALQQPDQPFVLTGRPEITTATGTSRVVAALAPRRNPFINAHWDAIATAVRDSLPPAEHTSLSLTGDARLTFHLNRLLGTGMRNALLVICGLLVLVLLLVFRRPTIAAAPLLMFLLAIAGTTGLMGLLDVSMSAYTLSLFPLFVGIGVDDCFHVGHLLKQGGSLRESPHVLLAITMTSLTTLAGYGSLMVARNPGFHDMGLSAIIGLGIMYLGAIWMLPAFFWQPHQAKIHPTNTETRE